MTTLDEELIEREENHGPVLNPYANENSIFYKGLFGMIICLTPGSIIGLLLVNVSLNQSKEAISIVGRNSEKHRSKDFRKIRNGRIMAIIGLSLFILEIVALVGYMSMI